MDQREHSASSARADTWLRALQCALLLGANVACDDAPTPKSSDAPTGAAPFVDASEGVPSTHEPSAVELEPQQDPTDSPRKLPGSPQKSTPETSGTDVLAIKPLPDGSAEDILTHRLGHTEYRPQAPRPASSAAAWITAGPARVIGNAEPNVAELVDAWIEPKLNSIQRCLEHALESGPVAGQIVYRIEGDGAPNYTARVQEDTGNNPELTKCITAAMLRLNRLDRGLRDHALQVEYPFVFRAPEPHD